MGLAKIYLAAFVLTSEALLNAVDSQKPNIIFILTDDQDIILGGLTPMEKAKRLLTEEGVTFSNAFATTPVCCPSRSSLLTGLYLHNTQVLNNSYTGGCASYEWQGRFENRSFGKYIQDSGYTTFYAGKYLNDYGFDFTGGISRIPPGWDWWVGLNGNSRYYNYTLSVNGTQVDHGDKEEDYFTDVIKEYALDFLKQKHIIESQDGFLMAINTPAAHDPFLPAPKYLDSFKDIKAPRTPNYNTGTDNKHWLVRLPPHELPQDSLDEVDKTYRGRWGTLLSVDDLIEEVIAQLTETNLIDNTYIIFTSDHGFHFAQFAMPWDKRQLYENDIRVPFIIRGPGVPKNITLPQPVTLIDLAPTMLEIAGVIPQNMDGQSFLPYLNNVSEDYNRTFLIEHSGESSEQMDTREGCWSEEIHLQYCFPQASCKCEDVRNNTYSCLRHMSNERNEIYCEFKDEENFKEMYDLNEDPWELENLITPENPGNEHYHRILECVANTISGWGPENKVDASVCW